MMNEFTEGPMTLAEMRKIISLLENPPEALMIRRALRFYEVPKDLEYKWGIYNGTESDHVHKILDHFDCPQDKYELEQMLKLVAGKERVLEIGSSFGGTLKRMAAVMKKGSQLVSVDNPVDATPKFLNPLASLKETCRQISILGGNVELFTGDSHNKALIEAVRKFAPFDFGFIDGDHTYEGVKLDWENYSPMCKIVALHDIVGPVEGCHRFWDELKATTNYRTEEFIGGMKFGIGVVYRE